MKGLPLRAERLRLRAIRMATSTWPCLFVAVLAALGTLSATAARSGGWEAVASVASGSDAYVKATPNTVDAGRNGDYVGAWVSVSWGGLSESDFSAGDGDEVCHQSATESRVCTVTRGGIWMGIFPLDTAGASSDAGSSTAPRHAGSFQPVADHSFPRSAPFIDPAPLKWVPITDTQTSGTLRLNVINWRTDLQVVLFKNGTTNPIPLAYDVIAVTGQDRPSQGHLARTADATQMKVTFSAKGNDASARIMYGTMSGVYTRTAAASAHTYTKDDLCGEPATAEGWLDPPFIYDATLTGLATPGQTIFYIYGGDAMGWSQERSFRTPRNGPDETLEIVAVADMGSAFPDGSQYHWIEPSSISVQGAATVAANRSSLLMSHIGDTETFDADLALMVGDLSYATGYAGLWDNWMNMIEPLASRVPYMTAQGNHEKDAPGTASFFTTNDSGGECGVPTTARFRMPLPNGNTDAYNSFYSFEQGPVHFITLDTEIAMDKKSEQAAFFEADLASVNRTATPWVVTMGHRPLYSCWGRDAEIGAVEDLMMKYKVDLALWGHVHNAQVTCPVYKGKCMEKGEDGYAAPIHAVIGNAGQMLDQVPLPSHVKTFTRYFAPEFGYSTISVEGDKRLSMRLFGNLDDKGMEMNHFELHYSFEIDREEHRRSSSSIL